MRCVGEEKKGKKEGKGERMWARLGLGNKGKKKKKKEEKKKREGENRREVWA